MEEQLQEFKKQLEEVQQTYGLEQKVVDWILAKEGLHAQRIEDFLKFVTKEEEIGPLVETIEGLASPLQQKSRVRQAWDGLVKARALDASDRRRKADDVDMDQLLPQPDLDDLADNYFARYHLSYPPDVMPADTLVSRAAKEIGKRTLSLPDVWKVKTQK